MPPLPFEAAEPTDAGKTAPPARPQDADPPHLTGRQWHRDSSTSEPCEAEPAQVLAPVLRNSGPLLYTESGRFRGKLGEARPNFGRSSNNKWRNLGQTWPKSKCGRHHHPRAAVCGTLAESFFCATDACSGAYKFGSGVGPRNAPSAETLCNKCSCMCDKFLALLTSRPTKAHRQRAKFAHSLQIWSKSPQTWSTPPKKVVGIVSKLPGA